MYISYSLFLFLSYLVSLTPSYASPHLNQDCGSCHTRLTKIQTHPFSSLLKPQHRRNPRCMRCHTPLKLIIHSSFQSTSASIKRLACQVCHIPEKKKSSSPVSKSRWLSRCKTCHHPPFSSLSPPSLEMSLRQLQLSHTLFPLKSSVSQPKSKTGLDSSPTFQVHPSPQLFSPP